MQFEFSIARLGRTIVFAACFAGFSAAALAQDAPDPASVVATVDGTPITEADLGYAAEDLAQELANVPPGDRRAYLVGVLVDMKVMANAARKAEMQTTEAFQQRLAYLEDRALRRAYFSEQIAAKVTPEALQEAYQNMIADFTPEEEVRARHILVTSEDDIKSIAAEIAGGKLFEVAAMEYSIDGSAQSGGDLNYFTRGMMVPPFEEAAFALEPGEVSEPVQSQFGWHLIKLEDRRQSSPPSFEQIGRQVQQQMLIETFNNTISDLTAEAEVAYTDPALAAAMAEQNGLVTE